MILFNLTKYTSDNKPKWNKSCLKTKNTSLYVWLLIRNLFSKNVFSNLNQKSVDE